MEASVLEQGIRQQLPAIEGFLKTILLKKINADIPASSLAESDMLVEALKTGTVVTKVHEHNFGVDFFIAFDETWIPQLSNAMLGVEESDVNEITRDLVKEFSQQLAGTIQTGLKDVGIAVSPGEVELLKSAQIASSVTGDQFFIVQVEVSGRFEIEGDEPLQMASIVAFGIPDEATIAANLPEEETPAEESREEPQEIKQDAQQEEETDFAGAVPDSPLSDDEITRLLEEDDDDDDLTGSEAPVAAPVKPKKEKPQVKGTKVDFDDFNPELDAKSPTEVRNLEILKDVELDISVELGRKELPLGEVLHLVRGSIIELDKLAGEPVEIYANGHRIAEGEVVVIDEHFGVRITNLVSARERLASLR